MPTPSTGLLTSFTGVDEAPLSEDGTWSGPIQSGRGLLRRVSNEIRAATSGSAGFGGYYNVAQFTNCEVYATITTPPTVGGESVVVLARIQNPGHATLATWYVGAFHKGTGWRMFRAFNGATFVQVGSTTAGFDPVAGDKILLSVVDQSLTLSHWTAGDWYTRVTATDANIVGPGYIGAQFDIVSSAVAMDDFGGGEVGSVMTTLPDFARSGIFPFAPAEEFIWIGRGRPGRLGASGLMRGTGPHPFGGFERQMYTRLHPVYPVGLTDIPIDAVLSLAADLSRVVNRNISPGLTLTAAVSRVVQRIVSPALTLNATLSRVVQRPISTTLTFTPAIVFNRLLNVAVSTALTLNPAVVRRVNRPIATSLTFTPTVSRIVNRPVSVALTLAAAVKRVVNRNVTPALTLNASVTRVVNRPVSVTLTLTSNVALARILSRSVNVGLTMTAAVNRTILRPISVSLPFTVTVSRRLNRSVSLTLTLSPAVSRRVNRTIATALTLTSFVGRVVTRPIATSLTLSAAVNRVVKRNLDVALTFVANVGTVIIGGGGTITPITIPVTLALNVSVSRVVKRTIAAPLLFTVGLLRLVPGGSEKAARARNIILSRFGIY